MNSYLTFNLTALESPRALILLYCLLSPVSINRVERTAHASYVADYDFHGTIAYSPSTTVSPLNTFADEMLLKSTEVETKFKQQLSRLASSFSIEENAVVLQAIADAQVVLRNVHVFDHLWQGINDEGVVMLRWEKEGDTGVLALFQGDGTYAYSHKETGTYYFSEIRSDMTLTNTKALSEALAKI